MSELERLDRVISQYNQLDGIRESLLTQKGDLILRLSDLEHYLSHSDEVTQGLSDIQRSMHSGTTEKYESLLTDLLHVVMPGDPENHRVVMNHFVRAGAVALKTEIETVEGYRHDIYENKGQSVENILALCLRFLALGRTSNRRLLMFDESDHGIMPSYMPKFIEVLFQITHKVGMQVIYISHHDWRMFEGKARIIEISKQAGVIQADVKSDMPPDAPEKAGFDSDISEFMSGIGIRYLRLKDYKAHTDTTIELSPFLNVIIGKMDLGKSSIAHAINQLRHNKGSVSNIKNGARSFEIEVGIEGGMSIEWTYSKDLDKKSKYVLRSEDGTVHSLHEGAKSDPDFLGTYLAMPDHRGYDLHYSGSHDSSFIFSKGVSDTRAAEILSFDDEITRAQDLLAKHKANVVEYKRETNRLKKELSQVKSRLVVLSAISADQYDAMVLARSNLRSEIDSVGGDSPSFMADQIDRQDKAMVVMSSKMKQIIEMPVVPEDALGLGRVIAEIADADAKISALSAMEDVVAIPASAVVEDISPLLSRMEKSERAMSVMFRLKGLAEITAIDASGDSDSAGGMVISLSSAREQEAGFKQRFGALEAQGGDINNKIQFMIQSNQGVCPLCEAKH